MPHTSLPTVYHITHYKAGSQWVRAILEGAQPYRIVTPTEENLQFTHQPALPGMIYPTLYVTRAEFEAVALPEPHRPFVVIRDVRDTVVSYYHSMLSSHVPTPNVLSIRRLLEQLSPGDGLRHIAQTFGVRTARFQRSWLASGVPVYRYEDLLADPFATFRAIFDASQIEISDARLHSLIEQHAFSRVTGGRKRGTEDRTSHQRKGVAGDWTNVFDDALRAWTRTAFNDVLLGYGYETDADWSPALPTTPRPACWCGETTLIDENPLQKRCNRCGSLAYIGPAVTEIAATPSAMQLHLTHPDTLVALREVLATLPTGARVLYVYPFKAALGYLLAACDVDVTYWRPQDPPPAPGSPFDAVVFQHIWNLLADPLAVLEAGLALLASDGVALAVVRPLPITPHDHLPPPRAAPHFIPPLTAVTGALRERGLEHQRTEPLPGTIPLAPLNIGALVVAGRHPLPERTPRPVDNPLVSALLAQYDTSRTLEDIIHQGVTVRVQAVQHARAAGYTNPHPLLRGAVVPSEGWYAPEQSNGQTFSWVAADAQFSVRAPGWGMFPLALELEPGPANDNLPMTLHILTADGATVDTFEVTRRANLHSVLPVVPAADNTFTLRVTTPQHPLPNDPRQLTLRVFGFGVATAAPLARGGVFQGGDFTLMLGTNWYPREHNSGETFYWAGEKAELVVFGVVAQADLWLDLAPGPSLGPGPHELHVYDANSQIVGIISLHERDTAHLQLALEPGLSNHFRFVVPGERYPVEGEVRTLIFRLFGLQCRLGDGYFWL